ncbi:MAG TPA: ABC transporter permease subunit [Acidimicrobiales bacterium]|nr:ABC transporter permease subunit [Acidimicrobiales bacterium]
MTTALPLVERRWVLNAARALFFVGLIGLLEVLARTGTVSAQTLAAPSDILDAARQLVRMPSFGESLKVTLLQAFTAFALAGSLGTALAVGSWRWPAVRRAVRPYVMLGNSFPLILLYPMFVVIFGLGGPSVVALGLCLGLLPVFASTLTGLDGIPRLYLELADSIGCKGLRRYQKFLFPAARRLVLDGLRQSFVYVLIMVVAGQYLLSGSGLGLIIRQAYELFNVPQLYAGIVIVVLISFTGDLLLRVTIAATGRPGVR